jgi:hypothetical protein
MASNGRTLAATTTTEGQPHMTQPPARTGPSGWPPEVRALPVDDRWKLPVPYIVERPGGVPNFGVLDPHRARECYALRLCAMCGRPMGKEVALYGDEVSLEPGGFYIEAPTHEACMETALAGLCPFISRQHYRRRRVDDPEVMVLGDRDHLHEVGREIAKRPAIVAIAESYRMAAVWNENGQMPVYLAPEVVRVRRYAWVDGVAREVVSAATPAPAPEPEPERRVVRVQRRRLPRSRRRHP